MKWVFALLFIAIVIIFAVGYKVFCNVMCPAQDIPAKKEDIDDPNHLCAPTTRIFYETRNKKKDHILSKKYQELKIKAFDGIDLYGDLLVGENTKETVILVHGYKSCGWKDFYNIFDFYEERKCNILFVQNRGHNKSKAKYLGFSALDQYDVLNWCDKICELYPDTKIILHGVSMGGASVIHCSNKVKVNVIAIIDDCGFTSIPDITKHLMTRVYGVPYIPFGLAGSVWMSVIANVDAYADNGIKEVAQAKVPIMFVHGKDDKFVPVQMTLDMYNACCTRKDILIAENCGHAAVQSIEYEQYKEKVNQFIDKCY